VFAQGDGAGFQLRAAVLVLAAAGRWRAAFAPVGIDAIVVGVVLETLTLLRRRTLPLGLLAGRRRRLAIGGRIVDGAIGQQTHRSVERIVEPLEQGVIAQYLLDLLVQLERRQLQQPDRLLQLRRKREVLRSAKLQGLFHLGVAHMRKCSPRYTRRTDSSAMMSSGRPEASTAPWLMM